MQAAERNMTDEIRAAVTAEKNRCEEAKAAMHAARSVVVRWHGTIDKLVEARAVAIESGDAAAVYSIAAELTPAHVHYEIAIAEAAKLQRQYDAAVAAVNAAEIALRDEIAETEKTEMIALAGELERVVDRAVEMREVLLHKYEAGDIHRKLNAPTLRKPVEVERALNRTLVRDGLHTPVSVLRNGMLIDGRSKSLVD